NARPLPGHLAQITARCKVTGEDPNSVLVSVKSLFDHQLLSVMCKFKWKVDLDELTSADLMAKIEETIASVTNDTIPDIDRFFEKELKIVLRETNVEARIIKYFQRSEEVIQVNGLSSIFADADGVKEKCKLLKRSLQPDELGAEVDLQRCFVANHTKTRDVALFNLVLAKAKDSDIRFLASKAADRGKRDGGKDHKKGRPDKRKADDDSTKRGNGKTGSKTREGREFKKGKGASKGPKNVCLHCGKDHWLSECKAIPDSHKEKMLADHQAKRAKTPRSKRLKPDDEAHEPLKLPYYADSGSDWNIISRTQVQRLAEVCSLVRPVKLSEPVVSRAKGGHHLES
ncbi:TPA: hypothetical protein N0F65_003512, partial [Lagenidium giganteum]